MHIILGGTGHIGSEVAQTLLHRGEKVTVVTRSEREAAHWRELGADLVALNINDTARLREVIATGDRLFLLNPPASPDTDTMVEERQTLASILAALEGSGLEKIVALSTYGAQSAQNAGDLAVLFEMEQALAQQSIPVTVLRSAYLMSNWDASWQSAEQEGVVRALLPPGLSLPMVSPADVGKQAADLLMEHADKTGLYHIEGPRRYTPAEVAMAFAKTLHKPVQLEQIAREQWVTSLTQAGFSAKAAEAMAAMTSTTIDQAAEMTQGSIRGVTSLEDYIEGLKPVSTT